MKVGAIYIAPVKSLALHSVARARVTRRGLVGDREFFLITDGNRQFTMRDFGPLATVRATYKADPELLTLTFPDGRIAASLPERGEAVTARFFGQYDVEGFETPGPWNDALAAFTGQPIRLVRSGERRTAVDALPISLLSDASIEALRSASGESAFEERRFRPNVFIEGAGRAHQEDEWIGGTVRIGGAVARVRMRDPRCVMTTLEPRTGVHDFDTLRMIANYRTDQPKEVNFGVYGTIDEEGEITVGDDVIPL
jgi:uncharacterized protein YcbX